MERYIETLSTKEVSVKAASLLIASFRGTVAYNNFLLSY